MKPPAFQFYPDDFLGGVADMTQAEVGAYILLLCSQWGRGAIPPDPDRAALIAKGPVSSHVLAKFPNGQNPRLEAVRVEQDNYRQLQREKGLASGEARRKRVKTVVQPPFNHGSTAVQPEGQPKVNPPSPSPPPIHTPLPPKGGDEPSELDLSLPPQTPPPPPPKAKAEVQLRAERIMGRRESTPLTSGESRAYSKNRAAIEATNEDDWRLLERFYAAPQTETYARKDLATLLNNWNGEIDRAKKWQIEAGKKSKPTFTRESIIDRS